MAITTIEPQTAEEVLALLGSFAVGNNQIIFRGHSQASYRLQSTLHRAHGLDIPEDWAAYYDEMLCRYESGLARIGKLPPDIITKRDILEHARHYGLPSPCIDFTYSPYVALFFALSRLKRVHFTNAQEQYATIYALDIHNLGFAYTKFKHPDRQTLLTAASTALDFIYPYNGGNSLSEAFHENLPANSLYFMPYPAKFNTRMQKQCGCFIYDSTNYVYEKIKDLEDFLDKIVEPPASIDNAEIHRTTALTKIQIPIRQTAKKLLSHLELMGILGMFIYDSPEGVASDVANSYFYNSKTLLTRDRFEAKS